MKTKIFHFKLLLPTAFLLAWPASASAITMELLVYNGVDVIAAALRETGLILSDSALNGLAFTVGLLGFFFAFLKAFSQGLNAYVKNLLPIFIGATLFVSVTSGNTHSLIVQDQVSGKTATVGGLPWALVVLIGGLNSFETALIDITETAKINQDTRYQYGAGGIGFDLLKQAATIDHKLGDAYTESTLDKYIDDCVKFELIRPGSTISLNELNNNTNLADVFGKADSSAVYTEAYSAANPEGVSVSCYGAWHSYLVGSLSNSSTYGDMVQASCSRAGMDPNDVTQLTACMEVMEANLRNVGLPAGLGSEEAMRQIFLAQKLDQHIQGGTDADVIAMANNSLLSQGISNLMIATEYVPLIKAVMTALVISLFPIIAITLPSQANQQAFMLYLGLNVFLAMWGVIDAGLHTLSVIVADIFFDEIATGNMGYAAVMTMPSAAGKSLGLVGMIRSASIILAAVFSSAFVKSGATALSSFGGRLMAPLGTGAGQIQAGQDIGKAHQMAQSLEHGVGHRLAQGMPNMGGQFLDQAEAAASQRMISGTSGSLNYNWANTATQSAGSQTKGALIAHDQVAKTAANQGSSAAALYGQNQTKGHLDANAAEQALKANAQEAGVSPEAARQMLANHQVGSGIGHAKAANELGMSPQEKAQAMETQSVQSALGTRAGEQQLMNTVGIKDYESFKAWRASGSMLTPDMVKFMRDEKGMAVFPGMRVKDLAVDQKGNSIMSVEAPLTQDNLADAKAMMRDNHGDLAAQGLQEGQMMSGVYNLSTGQGSLTATRENKSHASDVKATTALEANTNKRTDDQLNEQKQGNLVQDINQTVVKDGNDYQFGQQITPESAMAMVNTKDASRVQALKDVLLTDGQLDEQKLNSFTNAYAAGMKNIGGSEFNASKGDSKASRQSTEMGVSGQAGISFGVGPGLLAGLLPKGGSSLPMKGLGTPQNPMPNVGTGASAGANVHANASTGTSWTSEESQGERSHFNQTRSDVEGLIRKSYESSLVGGKFNENFFAAKTRLELDQYQQNLKNSQATLKEGELPKPTQQQPTPQEAKLKAERSDVLGGA